jgi:hypothetical protein
MPTAKTAKNAIKTLLECIFPLFFRMRMQQTRKSFFWTRQRSDFWNWKIPTKIFRRVFWRFWEISVSVSQSRVMDESCTVCGKRMSSASQGAKENQIWVGNSFFQWVRMWWMWNRFYPVTGCNVTVCISLDAVTQLSTLFQRYHPVAWQSVTWLFYQTYCLCAVTQSVYPVRQTGMIPRETTQGSMKSSDIRPVGSKAFGI